MKDQVVLRDATADDIEDMTLLVNHLGYPTSVTEMQVRYERIAAHADYKTLLAVVNDETVGMAGLCKGYYYEKNQVYMRVLAFVIKQNVRGLGVGKILLKAAEDWAVDQGLQTVIINSGNREERVGAHAFYKKRGYEIKSSGFVKEL